MSDSPSEIPPIRVGQANPWSGLSPEGGVPSGRPLKFAEKLSLRGFLRFRDNHPARGWLVRQSALNVSIMSALFAFFCGLLWFLLNALFAISGNPETAIAWDPTYAFTIWLSLTLGSLVRDQFEMRSAIDAWPLIRRVVKFDTVERMLESGTLPTESDADDAQETSA